MSTLAAQACPLLEDGHVGKRFANSCSWAARLLLGSKAARALCPRLVEFSLSGAGAGCALERCLGVL